MKPVAELKIERALTCSIFASALAIRAGLPHNAHSIVGFSCPHSFSGRAIGARRSDCQSAPSFDWQSDLLLPNLLSSKQKRGFGMMAPLSGCQVDLAAIRLQTPLSTNRKARAEEDPILNPSGVLHHADWHEPALVGHARYPRTLSYHRQAETGRLRRRRDSDL